MTTLTKSNLAFYKKLGAVLKSNPAASLAQIAKRAGLSLGGVSWHLSILKKEKYVKRDKKGKLVASK